MTMLRLFPLILYSLLFCGCSLFHDASTTGDETLLRERLLPRQVQNVSVTSKALNMRKCPATNCAVVEVLHKGDMAELLDRRDDWAQIINPASGSTGWVALRFLSGDTEVNGGEDFIKSPPLPLEELAP